MTTKTYTLVTDTPKNFTCTTCHQYVNTLHPHKNDTLASDKLAATLEAIRASKTKTTTAYELDFTPTEDDIQAYNADQAALEAERVEQCLDGNLHYWVRLTTGERIGYSEMASQRELDAARKCLKCGAWK